MGFLDYFFGPSTPTVQSILPPAAVNEIMCGRLPILNTNRVFLRGGETCHYIDKAIYEKKIVRKRYERRNRGTSYPGIFFPGIRHHYGKGYTDVTDNVQYETYRGILYITNRRIIFQGEQGGFVALRVRLGLRGESDLRAGFRRFRNNVCFGCFLFRCGISEICITE